MAKYEKPVAIVTNEISEGIYAASGAAVDSVTDSTTNQETSSSGNSSASYSLKQTNAWDGNKQYDITLTNQSDKKVDSITVTVDVVGNVTSIGGNVTGTVKGNKATITSNNYGNGFAANTSATFYMAVTGTGEFSLK